MNAIPDSIRKPRIPPGFEYVLSIGAMAAAVLLRQLLDPYLGSAYPLVTLFGAVAAAAWLVGWRPSTVAAVIGYLACDYLFVEPRGELSLYRSVENFVGLLAYVFTCAMIIGLGEAMRRARRRAREREDLLRITLRSIGDAVITTDAAGRVTDVNDVATTLTGWSPGDARGRRLGDVFTIINETTREPVESPVTRSIRDGVIVGLANHTVLIRRDGTE